MLFSENGSFFLTRHVDIIKLDEPVVEICVCRTDFTSKTSANFIYIINYEANYNRIKLKLFIIGGPHCFMFLKLRMKQIKIICFQGLKQYATCMFK